MKIPQTRSGILGNTFGGAIVDTVAGIYEEVIGVVDLQSAMTGINNYNSETNKPLIDAPSTLRMLGNVGLNAVVRRPAAVLAAGIAAVTLKNLGKHMPIAG